MAEVVEVVEGGEVEEEVEEGVLANENRCSFFKPRNWLEDILSWLMIVFWCSMYHGMKFEGN